MIKAKFSLEIIFSSKNLGSQTRMGNQQKNVFHHPDQKT